VVFGVAELALKRDAVRLSRFSPLIRHCTIVPYPFINVREVCDSKYQATRLLNIDPQVEGFISAFALGQFQLLI
jgi:hypothetical protein